MKLSENEFVQAKIDTYPCLEELANLWDSKFAFKEEDENLLKLKKIFINIFNCCYRSCEVKSKYSKYEVKDITPDIKRAKDSIDFLFKMYKSYTYSYDSPVEEIRNIMKDNKKRRKHNR